MSRVAEKSSEVLRILTRYLVEVVEAYDLCPWARSARTNGEVAIEVLWGAPPIDTWIAAARRALDRPATRVAMVVAPELAIEPRALRTIRDEVSAVIRDTGVAEFHPRGIYDATSPARLVPYLRRSPDPLLQLVPLSLLQTVRGAPPAVDRALQMQILSGLAAPPRGDVADRIAADNHATVAVHKRELAATLDAITADRDASYAAAGIGATGSASRRA